MMQFVACNEFSLFAQRQVENIFFNIRKTQNHSYMKLKCEKTQRPQKHCSISFKIDSNYHKLFW
jgi:hypothetical protein